MSTSENNHNSSNLQKQIVTILLISIASIYLTTSTIFVGYHLIIQSEWLMEIMHQHFVGVIVLPAYAFGVLLFVILLDIRSKETIEFEALGFKLKGASAPIALWMACMLVAIIGLKLLW